MSPEPEIIFQEYGIQLRREIGGELHLSVLCGRILEYEVSFDLNETERDAYERDGAEALRALAKLVMDDPVAYSNRGSNPA